MKRTLKYLSLINVIGLSVVSISLIIYILIKPFAWSELLIAVNLLISIPFIVFGIVTLRNIENPNDRKIQITLIAVFLILWLPSIGLPFAYELGGFIICLLLFGLGLWGVLKVKNTMNKMIYINLIGMFFLFLNTLVAFVTISEKL